MSRIDNLKGVALAVAALFSCHGAADAAKVTVADALGSAVEFFRAGRGNDALTERSLNLVFTGGTAANPLYYVFNAADGKGFVMISADDCTEPVLGYSLTSTFSTIGLPAPMQWMMAGLEAEIAEAPALQPSIPAEERRARARRTAKAPALQTKVLPTAPYSQEAPFNGKIPGHPLVGCVGTAMGSIMKYYEWPKQGRGSFGGVDFNVAYDWANILNSNYRSGYNAAQADAVATLMYHASKSINTEYSLSGSSAYEQRVPLALANYFGYDPGASYKRRSDVASQEEWDALIRAEIDADRPVIYCGQDVTAGHAFICDGYDNQGMLHFNWGWGGAANGFYRTSALNPVVSRSHSYNNFNTIIFNIKPYTGTARWSALHITADNAQAGMGSDMTDLNARKPFNVCVGNIRNLGYDDFRGQIAVALFAADGSFKALLSKPRGFNMRSMATLQEETSDNSLWLNGCVLPAGVTAEESDEVRMASSADNGASWNPMGGELYTSSVMKPLRSAPEYFSVSLPASVAGATVKGDDKVIRQWNYTFTVTPTDPANDVVTVKANGRILTPSAANSYTIANVTAPQEVAVIVQKAADVVARRALYVKTPGTLSTLLSDTESAGVKDLSLFGNIDARDFTYMRTKLRLERLDLSGVYISAYDYDQACALPFQAFSECRNLREVILPSNLNRINNGAFRYSGIQSITIPAGVSKYEYNVFVGCYALRHIWVGRQNAEFINWCVLSGCNKGAMTLHVPTEAARRSYSAKDNWKEIGNIIVDPIPAANDVAFAVSAPADVDVTSSIAPGARYAKGTTATFTVKNLSALDCRLDIYANDTKLTPAADGTYSVPLMANTLVHFDFAEPIATVKQNQFWSIASVDGSQGMISDIVNVIRGQEFTVQVNNLNVPAGSAQQYWAMALCDRTGDIKEFVSPVVMSTFSHGNGNAFQVKCCVRDSEIREGNQIRLVSSFSKKNWDLIPGASADVRCAVQALNNQNKMYTLAVTQTTEGDAPEAQVLGPGASVTAGFDYKVKIVAPSASHRVDVTLNGEPVATLAQSYILNFRAVKDMEIGVRVYPFIEIDEVTIALADGERLIDGSHSVASRLNECRNLSGNIKSKVTIIGNIDDDDFALMRDPEFRHAVKILDLSRTTIVANRTNGATKKANVLPQYAFCPASDNTPGSYEEILLPSSIIVINDRSFINCANIRELVLPTSLRGGEGSFSETKLTSGGGLNYDCFKGCTSLQTLYLSSGPVNGLVNHIRVTATKNNDLGLGLDQCKKITLVVRPEHYKVYSTPERSEVTIMGSVNLKSQNTWVANGFNIVDEYPVYGIDYNPTHCFIAEKNFNADRAVSFLGENIGRATISLKDKLFVSTMSEHSAKPAGTAPFDPSRTAAKVRVYDNGTLLPTSAVGADGSIDVTYYNPNNHANVAEGRTGNHNVRVVYLNDVTFNRTSQLFAITLVDGVRNDEATAAPGTATRFERYDETNPLAPVLRNVAEGDMVRFRADLLGEHEATLEARVKVNGTVYSPDTKGVFSIPVEGADIEVEMFAVPVAGAPLTAEEFQAMNVEEAAASTTSLTLTGDIPAEILTTVKEQFTAMEKVDFSEMTSEVPEGMFSGNTTVTSVALPKNATCVAPNTFAGCSSLAAVNVPESVTAIGAGAFSGCSSLAELTLTGVDEIGAGAFSGCSSLTAITLNAANGSEGAAAAPGRRRSAAIHRDAFAGLNPNCLILLDEGMTAPAAEANFVATAMVTSEITTETGDVILNKSRAYTAASDIRFEAGSPLAIANGFTVDATRTVTLTAPAASWSPLMVPFAPESIALGSGAPLSLSVNSTTDTAADRLTVVAPATDATETEQSFVRAASLSANTPYLMRLGAAEGSVVFTGSNVAVPASPEAITAPGKQLTLVGSYKPATVTGADVYLLQGDTFLPLAPAAGDDTNEVLPPSSDEVIAPDEQSATQSAAEATEAVALPAYTVYATSASGFGAIPIKLSANGTTAVDTLSANGSDLTLTLDANGRTLLHSSASRTVNVYTPDGRLIATLTLRPGTNPLPNLPAGLYLIDTLKVKL